MRIRGQSQFPIYNHLGVGIYETLMSWNSVAPTRPANPLDPTDPAYHWPAELDDAIALAAPYGIRVMIQISGAPGWANGGRAPTWAPLNPQDYADFATAAARRYPSVHLWMIWGEPNRWPNFTPLTPAPPGNTLTPQQAVAPRKYAQVLDAAYGALKDVDLANIVIGGDTFTAGTGFLNISALQWIKYMRLPNGRPPRLDLYGHNPFTLREPNFSNPPSPNGALDFSDLPRLASIVDHYLAPPRRHIRLFLSEWTIPTDAPDVEFYYHVTRAVQAKWIRSALRLVNGWSGIYALGWIHLYDGMPPGSRGGLLDGHGRRKPGFLAFEQG